MAEMLEELRGMREERRQKAESDSEYALKTAKAIADLRDEVRVGRDQSVTIDLSSSFRFALFFRGLLLRNAVVSEREESRSRAAIEEHNAKAIVYW